MAYKARIEELDNGTVAIYVKDEEGYLRVDGELPMLERQLLRTGEPPNPTYILEAEMAAALAAAIKPQIENNDNGMLLTLRALHENDRENIAFMREIIAKLICMPATTGEPIG